MTSFDPSLYGNRIASVYDEWYDFGDEGDAADCLAELADGGRVLELGIGTGRLAIPLRARGLEVHGIDTSEEMIAKLREKPGGERIPVTLADFVDVPVDGEFSLIFTAFNTFFLLRTQEEQVRCFEAVSRRLAEGGLFVVEAFVPDLSRFDRGQRVGVVGMNALSVRLEITMHDLVGQTCDGCHVVLGEHGVGVYPVRVRYAWPSELDLMARLAGLRLRHRWESWRRDPLTATSAKHVSVYERAPERSR